MPYQHPQVVKHSEERYFYFHDFSLVLFLDLLFVLCRVLNENGLKDVLWIPGLNQK